MAFDIIKLIIFGANSAYFLYIGAAQSNLIYSGIGILLFFVMIGIVGFISGNESMWTLPAAFIVTVPCNIRIVNMLLFDMIYKKYPDSFDMLYVTGYTHKIFRLAFSELSVWQKIFTASAGILAYSILLMAELYISGMMARLLWTQQKDDAIDELAYGSVDESGNAFWDDMDDELKDMLAGVREPVGVVKFRNSGNQDKQGSE